MNTVALKLLTVIAEALSEVQRAGGQGLQRERGPGEGSRGVRASEWEGRNVKIETLVSAGIADLILQHVAAHYFPNYAVVAHVSDVQVVRGEKYA